MLLKLCLLAACFSKTVHQIVACFNDGGEVASLRAVRRLQGKLMPFLKKNLPN